MPRLAAVSVAFCCLTPLSAADWDLSLRQPQARPAPYVLDDPQPQGAGSGYNFWLDGSYRGGRAHAGTGASYDQLVAEGGAVLASWADHDAALPWQIRLGFDGDYRELRSRDQGNHIPRLVISAQERAILDFEPEDGETAAELEALELSGARILRENTLPLDRMFRFGVNLNAQIDLNHNWSAHTRVGWYRSRSRGGEFASDREIEIGVAYAFHEREQLLLGVTYADLTPYAQTEERLLPLIEWHARYSPNFILRLGFPRAGFTWQPSENQEVDFRYQFPYDGELSYRLQLRSDVGVSAQAYHRGRAYHGGVNEVFIDLQSDEAFFFPNADDLVIGRRNRLYLREAVVQAGLWWEFPRLGLHLEGGPVWAIREFWSTGASMSEASNAATLESGLGGYLTMTWRL